LKNFGFESAIPFAIEREKVSNIG